MRASALAYTTRVVTGWESPIFMVSPPPKLWRPKNPEIVWPDMDKETRLSQEQWDKTGFPSCSLPSSIVPRVSKHAWSEEIKKAERSVNGHAAVPLLNQVLCQLDVGVNSMVGPPGTQITRSSNFFTHPTDIQRMADALATEVKKGTMAGPFNPGDLENVKINGFLAVPKANGDRRHVGHLSAPKGRSFNDGVDKATLKEWPVAMTTSRQFAAMLCNAGKEANMSKSDMVGAYKCLKVTKDQRLLQGFEFCGKVFIDMCMIFGDTSACMNYDRFHFLIVMQMVLPDSLLPARAIGRTVDDITTASPAAASQATTEFVRLYREKLGSLGIEAAESDQACIKAFDHSKRGEVLGIVFNTVDMVWNLSHTKTYQLKHLLDRASMEDLSLHDVEVLHGKITHFSQLSPPTSILSSSLVALLRDLLEAFAAVDGRDRQSTIMVVPKGVKEDCRVLASVVADTMLHPLPILMELEHDLSAINVFPDASGCLLESPSLGILVEAFENFPPLVASLRFPHAFLINKDKQGKEVSNKTTLLESLAFLATILLDPIRFANRPVLFHIDNAAAVGALFRGRSKADSWATTVIKAARNVAGVLGSSLQATWTPRRSCPASIKADDLSHGYTSSLSRRELLSLLEGAMIAFPLPVKEWMADPQEDKTLGRKCVLWMVRTFPALQPIIPKAIL